MSLRCKTVDKLFCFLHFQSQITRAFTLPVIRRRVIEEIVTGLTEKLSVTIFRVSTVNFTLKMEGIKSCETSVTICWHPHVPEGLNLHQCDSKKYRSHI